MKIKVYFSILFFLFLASESVYSQEKNQNLTLVEQFGRVPYAHFSALMDGFGANLLNSEPNSIGYIVIYAGRSPIISAFMTRAVILYSRSREFDKLPGKKLIFLTSKDSEDFRVDFWIGKNGVKPAVKEAKMSYRLPLNKPTKFIDDSIETIEIDGKQRFYSGSCDDGCIEILNFELTGKFLSANLKLQAFVIIRNNNLQRTKKLKSIFVGETAKSPKLSNRYKFIYGGRRQTESYTDYFEVSVYFSPSEKLLKKYLPVRYKYL